MKSFVILMPKWFSDCMCMVKNKATNSLMASSLPG